MLHSEYLHVKYFIAIYHKKVDVCQKEETKQPPNINLGINQITTARLQESDV